MWASWTRCWVAANRCHPNLDQLFALPAAAVRLQVASDLRPTGIGSVCFKAAEGAPFAGMRAQVEQLLALDGGRYTEQADDYGFTWLVRRTDPPDLESLVTDLHAVNSGLLDAGFGSALLCTVICFTGGVRPLALVYLYKRGTWYPFAPLENGSVAVQMLLPEPPVVAAATPESLSGSP